MQLALSLAFADSLTMATAWPKQRNTMKPKLIRKVSPKKMGGEVERLNLYATKVDGAVEKLKVDLLAQWQKQQPNTDADKLRSVSIYLWDNINPFCFVRVTEVTFLTKSKRNKAWAFGESATASEDEGALVCFLAERAIIDYALGDGDIESAVETRRRLLAALWGKKLKA